MSGKEDEGVLCVAVLATKLIHLPDEPAGVGQIGTQTVELARFVARTCRFLFPWSSAPFDRRGLAGAAGRVIIVVERSTP